MNRREYIKNFFHVLCEVSPQSVSEGLQYQISLVEKGIKEYEVMVIHELSIVKNFSFVFSNIFTKNFTVKWTEGGYAVSPSDLNVILLMMSQNTPDGNVNLEAALPMILHNIYFPDGFLKYENIVSEFSFLGVGMGQESPAEIIREVRKIHLQHRQSKE